MVAGEGSNVFMGPKALYIWSETEAICIEGVDP